MMENYAGWIGGPEIIIIVVVILLLFGGKKIPELAKGIGNGIREFRKATDESDLASDLKDIKNEFTDLKDGVDNLNPTKTIKPKNPIKSGKKK